MYDRRSAKDTVLESERLLRTLQSGTEPTRHQIEAARAAIDESHRLVAAAREHRDWRARLGMRD
jgi:hypothetical protein